MKGYASFLNDLGGRESGGDYNVVNQYGYLGKYQMGRSALIDTGYYKKDKTNRYSVGWTGKDGICSREDFLNNPKVQEKAIRAYVEKQRSYIRHYGLDKYIGQTINGVKITESGLIAGAHLKGVGGLKIYLYSGGSRDVKDGNGTPISSYIKKFNNYKIGDSASGMDDNPASPPIDEVKPTIISGESYIVKRGDTLSKIAFRR